MIIKHDPIEDSEEYKAVVAEVDKKAKERVHEMVENLVLEYGDEDFIRSLPTFHRFAHEKKEILKNEYGIDWKSIIEMNPNIIFD